MIVNTSEIFEKAIVTAMDAESTVYGYMAQYIESAEHWMKHEILGQSLYDFLDEIPNSYEDKLNPERKADELLMSPSLVKDVLSEVRLAISLKAFYEGIPFIDLVLTPTGFGVVSNTNIAPASKERVERLQQRSLDSQGECVDRLIQMIPGNEKTYELWKESIAFRRFTNSLFWCTPDFLPYYGQYPFSRGKFIGLAPKIRMAEQKVQRYISIEYFNELIESMRKLILTETQKKMILSLRKVIGCIVNEMDKTAEIELERIATLMDDDQENYATYHASTTYFIKHQSRYENKKEDTTYFFG